VTRRQRDQIDSLCRELTNDDRFDFSIESLGALAEACDLAFASRRKRRRGMAAYLGEVLIRNAPSGRWVGTLLARPRALRRPAVELGEGWIADPRDKVWRHLRRHEAPELLVRYADEVRILADAAEPLWKYAEHWIVAHSPHVLSSLCVNLQ
jgi:hypothetical protein